MTVSPGFLLLVTLLSTPAPPDVVARVDGAAITASDLSARIAARKSAGASASPSDALGSLIDDALLTREGERLDLAREPEVAAQLEAKRRELAASRMLERELDAVRADDAAARALYHQSADQIRLDLVVVATKPEAEAVLGRIRAGARFAVEAQRSLDPDTVSRGGDTGYQLRMNLQPALADAAFAAPLDTPSGPVPLGIGWAVFQVRGRKIADEKGYAAARDDLLRQATAQLRTEAKRHFLEKKRAALHVQLDEAFLDTTGVSLEATPAQREHVLATVGRSTLRYGDVLPEVAAIARGAQRAHASGPAVKKDVARRRIDRMVLEDEAMARGYGRDPEVEAGVAAERRTLVGVAAALRIRGGAPAPTDADLEAWYRKHAAELTRPARRECAQIVAPSKDDAWAARRRVEAGARFEDVARASSTDGTTAAAGGRIGVIDLDRLDAVAKVEPALAGAIREAKAGALAGPVRSRAGWHVLRCGPVTPAAPAPLAEVRDAIVARVRAERGEEALRAALAGFRARAKISIDERRLAAAASL